MANNDDKIYAGGSPEWAAYYSGNGEMPSPPVKAPSAPNNYISGAGSAYTPNNSISGAGSSPGPGPGPDISDGPEPDSEVADSEPDSDVAE